MTHPSPPPASAPIAWVRAAFLGALAGGLLWAIAWKLFAVFGADTATALRIVGPIAIMWVPVAPLGAVIYRFGASPRRRTYLIAAVIALRTGVLLPVRWGFLSVNALRGSASTNGPSDGPPFDRRASNHVAPECKPLFRPGPVIGQVQDRSALCSGQPGRDADNPAA